MAVEKGGMPPQQIFLATSSCTVSIFSKKPRVQQNGCTPNISYFPITLVHWNDLWLIFENYSRILENSQSYCPHFRLKVRGFLSSSSTSFSKPVAALILENSRNSRMRMRILKNEVSIGIPKQESSNFLRRKKWILRLRYQLAVSWFV